MDSENFVPSSQPNEWELLLPDTTVGCEDTLSSTTTQNQDVHKLEEVPISSPEVRVVRTSQGVAEEELDAAWAIIIAQNLAALRNSSDRSLDIVRVQAVVTETSGYEAQDEYSSTEHSEEDPSPGSPSHAIDHGQGDSDSDSILFRMPESISPPPMRIWSSEDDEFYSDSSSSIGQTPSPVRRFRQMFEDPRPEELEDTVEHEGEHVPLRQ